MTFVENHRFKGSHTEKEILKVAWEGELFGVGLFDSTFAFFAVSAVSSRLQGPRRG